MHLADEYFQNLLNCLAGQRVGLAINRFGNVGDEIIHRATIELFDRHHIHWRILSDEKIDTGRWPRDTSLICEPGGGNVGSFFKGSPERRARLAALPGPKVILPQTAFDAGEDLTAFETVFARERTTYDMLRRVHSDVRLAPDMALSLRLPPSQPGIKDGVFMRRDREQAGRGGVDPVHESRTVDEYLGLAGRHQHIVTNRLHFAIAALLQDQAASICAGSYHKNRSMFDTWLAPYFPQATWGTVDV